MKRSRLLLIIINYIYHDNIYLMSPIVDWNLLIPKGLGVSIEDGTEIWKITRDGRQTLYAVFENKTFKIVDQ